MSELLLTLGALQARINERFPDSGLFKISGELQGLLSETEDTLQRIHSPHVLLRVSVAVLLLIICVTVSLTFLKFKLTSSELGLTELIPLVESFANDLLLICALIFFLVTLETRVKRRRALEALNQLRVVAHVIDMHQLTKDPLVTLRQYVSTASSPSRHLSPFELSRYLVYCSELLSMIGKLAALYAQSIPDPEVVAAVKDVEDLTLDLSERVWQKILLLNSASPE